jgi:hypothetical protein
MGCEDGFAPQGAECGRFVLYITRHFSITTCASFNEWKISPFKHSSRNFPLKLSQ